MFIKLGVNLFEKLKKNERIEIINAERQDGTTTDICIKALIDCLDKNKDVTIISLSNHSSKYAMNQILLLIEHMALHKFITTKNSLQIIFKNNKKIEFCYYDQQNLRGKVADIIYIDDFKHYKEKEELIKLSMCCLARNNGQLIIYNK